MVTLSPVALLTRKEMKVVTAQAVKSRMTVGEFVAQAIREASKPAADELALRQRHARIIRRSARILGIPPQVFFSWQMDYVTAALDDPDGLINEYAIGDSLEFPDEETRQEVRRRFEAWLRTKGVPADRVRHIMSRTTTTEEEAA